MALTPVQHLPSEVWRLVLAHVRPTRALFRGPSSVCALFRRHAWSLHGCLPICDDVVIEWIVRSGVAASIHTLTLVSAFRRPLRASIAEYLRDLPSLTRIHLREPALLGDLAASVSFEPRISRLDFRVWSGSGDLCSRVQDFLPHFSHLRALNLRTCWPAVIHESQFFDAAIVHTFATRLRALSIEFDDWEEMFGETDEDAFVAPEPIGQWTALRRLRLVARGWHEEVPRPLAAWLHSAAASLLDLRLRAPVDHLEESTAAVLWTALRQCTRLRSLALGSTLDLVYPFLKSMPESCPPALEQFEIDGVNHYALHRALATHIAKGAPIPHGRSVSDDSLRLLADRPWPRTMRRLVLGRAGRCRERMLTLRDHSIRILEEGRKFEFDGRGLCERERLVRLCKGVCAAFGRPDSGKRRRELDADEAVSS